MSRQDEFYKERLKKLDALKKAGINPYPQESTRSHTTAQLQKEHKALLPEHTTNNKVAIVGRLMSFRDLGKIAFGTVRDGTGTIQIVLQEPNTPGKVSALCKSYIDAGDIINVQGTIFRTKRGELSVEVHDLTLLTKSLAALPDKWHGLEDKEERYRKRYIDLVMSPDVRTTFETRATILTTLRSYLQEEGFLEVETPALQSIYGGASAAPFKTHLNALDIPLYLSISPELYLKRVVVGGFERVFTVCKNFRNEGIDRQHNPEFTMLEYYAAYKTYEYHMQFTEELFTRLKKALSLGDELEYQGKKINLTLPFKRVTFRDLMLKEADIDINQVNTYEKLKAEIQEKGLRDVDIRTCTHYGALLDELYKRVVRPSIVQPTFLTHYPVEMIALAKRNEKDPSKINSVQLIIDGAEIMKSYDELNDPLDQEARLHEQAALLKEGSKDAMPMDTDFIDALKLGLPPTAGYGMGIDRLTMLLTNSPSIRDVILFPFMKPEVVDTKKEPKPNGNILGKNPQATQLMNQAKSGKRKITRNEAIVLLKAHVSSESLVNHCLAVGASMKAYAQKYGEDENLWEISGILHDFDYEKYPEEHTLKGSEILIKEGYPHEIIHAILAHYSTFTGIERDTKLAKCLFAVDELSGLVTAMSKVRPSKFDEMDADSVEKALKKKEFAKNISREDIEIGIKELGVGRKEHFETIIAALKKLDTEGKK